MITFLKGYRTYGVAGFTITYAIIGVLIGQLDVDYSVQLILTALMGSALRAGIK